MAMIQILKRKARTLAARAPEALRARLRAGIGPR
jgi:hypothetical protein